MNMSAWERQQDPRTSVTIHTLPNRNLQLLLLTLAFAAAAYARTALNPVQESLRLALGLTDGQTALLQGPALALPIVLLAIPLGFLIDRQSRIRLLLMLASLDLIGSLLTALAQGFSTLIVGRCLVGLSAFATNPVALSLVSDLYSPSQRGRALTALALGGAAGLSGAFGLGGLLLSMSGSDQHDWRWVMLWLTAPLVFVLVALLIMREPPRTDVVVEHPSLRQALSELWAYRGIVTPLLTAVALAEIALGAMIVWAAPTLARTFTLGLDRVAGIMAFGLMVSGLLGPVAGGVLADVCQRLGGPRRTMTVVSTLTLACVPTGLFSMLPDFALAAFCLFVFITLTIAIVTMETTLFTIVVPNELRGLCSGMLVAVCVLVGTGLAPLTVSLLSTATGGPGSLGRALSIVCVAANVAASIVCILSRRSLPRNLGVSAGESNLGANLHP